MELIQRPRRLRGSETLRKMVRETSCNAEMEFVDVSAIADATDSSSAYTYQNLEKLKANEDESPYGTGELNQFILDGTKEILPDDVDVAYWSEKSNAECLFDTESTPSGHQWPSHV